jgi:hypothetical protein
MNFQPIRGMNEHTGLITLLLFGIRQGLQTLHVNSTKFKNPKDIEEAILMKNKFDEDSR